MKLLILTTDQPHHIALCHALAKKADLVGIVLSENVRKRPPKHRARLLSNRIQGRLVGVPFRRAWMDALSWFRERHSSPPAVSLTRVRNVNDPQTVELIERLSPDLVAVSGTNLVGRAVVEAASRRLGIVNLHTGLSPYVKGGPNCTNWCLAKGTFHLIGNTVMWLDLGIDTGAIIATEQTPLDGAESLSSLHIRVLKHAHALYSRTVGALAVGRTVPRVPQHSIAPGETFFSHEWTGVQMLRGYLNFLRAYGPEALNGPRFARLSQELRLIAVD